MGSIGQLEANVYLPARRQVSGGLKDTLGALKEKVGGVFGSERYAHHLYRAHLLQLQQMHVNLCWPCSQ